jgi:hypothetical protein
MNPESVLGASREALEVAGKNPVRVIRQFDAALGVA